MPAATRPASAWPLARRQAAPDHAAPARLGRGLRSRIGTGRHSARRDRAAANSGPPSGRCRGRRGAVSTGATSSRRVAPNSSSPAPPTEKLARRPAESQPPLGYRSRHAAATYMSLADSAGGLDPRPWRGPRRLVSRARTAARRSRACGAAAARGRASEVEQLDLAAPRAASRAPPCRRTAPGRRPGQPCGPWLKWLNDQSSAALALGPASGAKRSANSCRSRSRWLNVFEISTWVPAGTVAPSSRPPRPSRARAAASSARAASPPRGRPRGSRDRRSRRLGDRRRRRELASTSRCAGGWRSAPGPGRR